MRYALGHSLTIRNLLFPFPKNKLKMNCKNGNKSELIESIFRSCIKLIIDDIIDNNETFKLPTKARRSCIRIKRIDGDDFIRCRQNGKFQDINFLKSNFTGYQMIFEYQVGKVLKEKYIYLDSVNKDKITENTNNGKSYY